jgi:predicted nucleotidyltransferase
MKNLRLDVILREVKDYFNLLYQNRLEQIVLYGSQAREDGHEDSDIDLLVILAGVVNPYQEIDRTSEFIAQLCLDYDVVVSRHFISAAKFQSGDNPFLYNIRREGVTL